jgi:multiple sugar transport system permease protein
LRSARRSPRRFLPRAGRLIALALVLLWTLIPVYLGLSTSLMTTNAAQARPPQYFPHPLYLNNYRQILGVTPSGLGSLPSQFQRSLLNSTIEAVGSTVITLVVAIFAAYAFARLEFRFKRTILVVVIGTLLLPAYSTLLPLYKIISSWGLVNTYTGIILANASGFIPLAIWILYNYFVGLPKELEEAASVDGASPLRTLFRIILPLSIPGIAAAAAITFLFSWAQYLFPLVLTTDLNSEPVTVVVAALYGPRLVSFSVMAAAAIIAIVIPGALALLLNRFVISGLTGGSNR